MLDETSFVGQIVSIESQHAFAPRYNPSKNKNDLITINNHLLLCPNHHVIVDKYPESYTVEWLKRARKNHINIIKNAISPQDLKEIKLDGDVELSLEEALRIWRFNKENSSEEFWQKLLQKSPSVISQIFPKSMFQLGSKCYVGGKTIGNSGGNLVDFIYASNTTNNVVLVEIKTPITKLLGKKYRTNAYSISEELSGSFIQVLNYKDQLMKDYYKLSDGDAENSFCAFNPKCLIIVGSVESEVQNATQLKSLELFRNSVMNVEIVTYDELFKNAEDVLDMVK